MNIKHWTSKMNALTNPKQKEGPANSNSDSRSREAFADIPFDVKDHILSLIESPRDLLALGLTSRQWATMIIPLHIEYRELRIRLHRPEIFNQPEIWQHLATRTDLSKRIRKVCLMSSDDYRSERLPLTLSRSTAKDKTNSKKIHSLPDMMFQALSHFESLVSFTWLPRSNPDYQYTEEVFSALTNCHELVELILGAVYPRKDSFNPGSSIWKIRNLRILTLEGLNWIGLGDAECSFISMLNNSPALEELSIPYNDYSAKFTSCRFRSLIKLHLSAKSNTSIPAEGFETADNLIIDFLFAHPTIQHLSWYPTYSGLTLSPGLLPTLKHLCTSHRLATAFLHEQTLTNSRRLESISQIYLDSDTMLLLETIDGSRLQELHVWHQGVKTIRRLAVLFPTIKTFGTFNYDYSLGARKNRDALDEYVDSFAAFPLLENLYDSSIWPNIQAWQEAEKREAIIRKLYTQCPFLKTIRYWDAKWQLGGEIAIFRDGLDVTWKQTL